MSLYRQTVRDIEKDIIMFNGSNGERRKCSFKAEDYAVNAVRYISTILDISFMGGRTGLFIAFLLMLRVSDTAYGSLGDYNEDCGNADSEEHYGELDDALCWLIRRLVMDPMPRCPVCDRTTSFLLKLTILDYACRERRRVVAYVKYFC